MCCVNNKNTTQVDGHHGTDPAPRYKAIQADPPIVTPIKLDVLAL